MSKCQPAVLFIAVAIAFAGCSETRRPLAEPSASSEAAATPQALRVQADLPRGRRWELRWGSVAAYDAVTGQLVRIVPLPRASFAGTRETCLPDMALTRSGGVVVSSDAQPTLWRVTPSHFEVERFDIAVDSDREKDFGFSGLAWDADGKELYAVSAATGTLWRIDLESETARRIELSSPLTGACGLAFDEGAAARGEAATLVVTLGPGKAVRRILLAPDRAKATVVG